MLINRKVLRYEEVAQFDNFYWRKVFFHDYTNKACFTSEEEALKCLDQEDKYSILYSLNKYKFNDVFEFIIEYPSLNYYFRWNQTSNPCEEEEKEGKYTADGFNLIHKGSDGKTFGGLVKTKIPSVKDTNTLLNGVPGNAFWFYSIGMYCNPEGNYSSQGFPPADDPGTDIVILWVKDLAYKPNNNIIQIKQTTNENKNSLMYIFLLSAP